MKETFPLLIVNRDYRIVYVNESFSQLVKYKNSELIDKLIEELHIKPIDETDDCLIDENNINKHKYIKKKIEYTDKDGNSFRAVTSITSLLDETGDVSHYFIMLIDHLSPPVNKSMPIHPLQFLQTLEMAVNETNVVLVTDHKGIILSVNKRYTELSQYTPEEVIGKNPSVVKSGYQSPDFYENMWKKILAGEIWSGELRNRAKDGSIYWVHSTTVPILNKEGKPIMFINMQTDITRRMEAERSLQKALKNEFDKTVRNLYNVVFKYESDGDDIKFTLLEGQLVKQLNLSLGKMTMEQIAGRHNRDEAKRIEYHFYLGLSGHQTHFEVDLYEYALLIYLSPVFEGGKVREVVGTIVDITNRKKAENLAKQMAYYDFLTQLPNRRFLQEKAEELIYEHELNNASFAILFIDIDRFKSINDSMGHSAGDQLLIQLAKRLQDIVREDDFVARLGGDEFIVLLQKVTREEVEAHVNRIVSELKEPFNHRNLEVFVRPSIGISIFPQDGIDYETVLGSADIAMYKNKQERSPDYQFFNQTLRQNILERTLLEMDMQQAIDRGQFELHYQPKLDLQTKEIIGVEALLRWKHPIKGYIPPYKFIPLAEDTGAIVPIGQWILETASKQLKIWHDTGYGDLSMAVNISIAQFNHPKFNEYVQKALDDVELEAKYLNLEVTESMMLDKLHSEEKLTKLRNLGVDISIDDFGTGYSSLSYLSNFPITHLKIDQSFIHDFTKSNKAIVKTIISLAKALDVKVIAEGVEEEIHEKFLTQMECDEVQGYYYAKPKPAGEIEKLLKNR